MSAPFLQRGRLATLAEASSHPVRPCDGRDRHRLLSLIAGAAHLHRHLDWFDALERLDQQPFLIAERDGIPAGCLACPPHHPEVAWIHLLAAQQGEPLEALWSSLWAPARAALRAGGQRAAAALVQSQWLRRLLQGVGFSAVYDVVFLQREGAGHLPEVPAIRGLRPLRPQDLQGVAALDRRAFDPLWQLSTLSLQAALRRAVHATVIERDGSPVAYLIATRAPEGAHLGRLAVDPAHQRQGLGQALVLDALRDLSARGLRCTTVNTQSNNLPSLRLYHQLGFARAGESLPVYQVRIEAA